MSKFKNRIITISGDPGSGKNTIANKLKEDYEKQGYKVYVFSVGDEARKIAQERGVSIDKLNSDMVEEKIIDELLDSKVSELGKKINSKERQDEVYIFVSRTAGKFIEGAITVRTTVDDNVAAKRVFEDSTRGKEDQYINIEEAKKAIISRKKKEIERFLEIYNFDLQNPDNYKLLIDTSYSTVEDIAQTIEQCLELEFERGKLEKELLSLREGSINVNNKLERIQQIEQRIEKTRYGKMWTSPKKLLPMQNEMDTVRESMLGYSLDEMTDIIEKEGYDASCPIETIEVDGRKYIIEGHHRNFASARLGKTLVPYEIMAKDDEKTPYGGIARERVKYMDSSCLWGHEWLFDKDGVKFSYEDVYPGIYKMIENGIDER